MCTYQCKIVSLSLSTLLTPEQMKEDLNQLIEELDLNHPLFQRDPKQKHMVKFLSHMNKDIAPHIHHPLPLSHFLGLTSMTLKALNDSHSQVFYPESQLDIHLLWNPPKLFVYESSGSLLKYDQILSMFGYTPVELMTAVPNYIPKETNTSYKTFGTDLIKEKYFWVMLGLSPNEPHLPVSILRQGETKQLDIPFGSDAIPRQSVGIHHFLSIMHNDPHHLYFKLPEFNHSSFERILLDGFRVITALETEELTFDLQFNPGGNLVILIKL